MTTEDLIRALAADRHAGQKPRTALLLALVPAMAFVAILFFSRIGFRDDIDDALHTVRFLFKFVVIVPLAVVTIGAMFRSTDPIQAYGWWTKLLPLPLVLLGAGVVAELLAIPRSDWTVRLIAADGQRPAGDLHDGVEERRAGRSWIERRDGGSCRKRHRGHLLCDQLLRRQPAVRGDLVSARDRYGRARRFSGRTTAAALVMRRPPAAGYG